MSPAQIASLQMLPVAVALTVLYFLYVRPEKREAKANKKMLQVIKIGDQIVTTGGVYGVVDHFIDSESLSLAISPEIVIRIDRKSVAKLVK